MTKLAPSHVEFPLYYPLLIFFLILGHVHFNYSLLLHDQEHAILLRIKQYLQDPPFLTHWTPSNSSHCSWPEITCTIGSITGLSLVNFSISQPIPPFLCDLKNLTHVDFHMNFIPGEFPTSLFNCSKLEYLDLSSNDFVGKIPYDIHRLENLQYLSLGSTNFNGDIPASLGRLNRLRVLRLEYCLFNGTFPDEIGNLGNLETLDLSSNTMLPPSKLPLKWTQLRKLKVFHMYGSNLIGEIPESIGEMVALEKLDISLNNLSGEIPSGLFMLKNLNILYLSRNKLSGEIPGGIEAFNISIIDISENNLTGKIPDGFGKLKNLTSLWMSVNNLSGEIPQSLGNLPSLVDFRVFMNKLSGTLPPDFGSYSKLEVFHVASNNFTGRLPQNLCYYGKLLNLTVYDNSLSGELPKSLGNCGTLLDLKIQNNEFSGNIPYGLWTSTNLLNFMVSHNKFTGELPERLSPKVSLFNISHNQFSGRIPKGVSSWTNVVVFDASKNYFNGSIPQELTILPKLTTLLLDQNHLTGPLPSNIVSWKSLVFLNLRQNQLSGQIPHAICQLPSLSELDLSQNQFFGQIPSQFHSLTNVNLSSNHLTGRIPSEFENSAYADSFLDNAGLCSDTPAMNLTLCNSKPQKPTKGSSSWSTTLVISLVVAVAFLLALLSSFLIVRFYGRRKGVIDTSWKLISFQKLSFTESSIVSSLTEQNIIGRGGYGVVYRVPVDGAGYVAVKKIWNNRKLNQKLENSFRAEVKILSNIRHNNIVKLLCCIFNDDSMLLVYEYLENHSLDRWLRQKGSVHHVVLDWSKRLQVAIGVAQGLSYMHHDCSPPIVHRDLKTSNILLDSQFNAKVADFGLARTLSKPIVTMSAVVGSFGYIAPEYAQATRVSEKIDVFSFGVILLELTTGKEANYGDEYSSLAEWAWRHVHVGSNIEELLDTDVMELGYLDEMCCVFKLGVMCTAVEPASRPHMKEILQILFRCGEGFVFGERNVEKYEVVPLLKKSKREKRFDVVDNDSD